MGPETNEKQEETINNHEKITKTRENIAGSDVVKYDANEWDHSVIYGWHPVTIRPEVLPDDLNYLNLESGVIPYTTDSYNEIEQMEAATQYKELMKVCKERFTPIVFSDPTMLTMDAITLPGNTELLPPKLLEKITLPAIVEGGVIPMYLTHEAAVFYQKIQDRELPTPTEMTRRDFLRLGAAAVGAGVVATAGAPLIRMFAPNETSAKITEAAEQIHPELWGLLVTARNVISAHKISHLNNLVHESASGDGFYDTKAHGASVWGVVHSGFETALESTSEERLEFIKSMKPQLIKYFDRKSLYTVAVLQYSRDQTGNNSKTLIEVPELKVIFEEDLENEPDTGQ